MSAAADAGPTRARIRLLTAGPEHLDQLVDLEAACLDDSWSRAQLADALDHSLTILALLPDGTGAGFALFRPLGEEAELLRIGVAPEHRQRGLGRCLLDAGLRRLARAGSRICHLEVAASNGAAIALYESSGFTLQGRRRGYYRGGSDALLMSRGEPSAKPSERSAGTAGEGTPEARRELDPAGGR
ncbi:MAG: GNAT family N-acetyltransferase [Acidobacteriota bacterium]|nr:GNAT family N-acetyltransferase [Acidobacteriota bacterium]